MLSSGRDDSQYIEGALYVVSSRDRSVADLAPQKSGVCFARSGATRVHDVCSNGSMD